MPEISSDGIKKEIVIRRRRTINEMGFMAEPRKIVLILGNGFDLDLGLRTSYKDFWESEYCPKDYPAPLIHHLNECWPERLDAVRWYDLENELYNYYSILQTGKRRSDIITSEERLFIQAVSPATIAYSIPGKFLDQAQSLMEKGILKEEYTPGRHYFIPYHEDYLESPVWRDKRALQLIKEGLCQFLKTIRRSAVETHTVAFQVLNAVMKCKEEGDFVNVYTFNYTQVYSTGHKISDSFVHHMHGNCMDGKIIIGTRDDVNMTQDYDFLQKGMDPSFFPPDLVTALREADEVIIFGHSLGENDRQYFAPFFLRQASENNQLKKEITIFTKDHESLIEVKRALQKMTDGRLSALYSINQPTIIKTKCVQEDQQLLFDFLVNHHTERHHAEVIIGKLLN